VSNTDAITKNNQPNFFGTSEPLSTIQLFAQTAGNAPVLEGQTEADSSGAWSITSDKLADGSYTITVMATDHAGFTTALTQLLPNASQGPLVIDTVAPRVTNVIFDRPHGMIDVTFQDDRSGMDQHSVIDGANYRLEKPHVKIGNILVTSLTPFVPLDPAGPEAVTAGINDGRPLKGGTYYFTIKSGGVQDVAGNALDGEFYGYFPSGDGRPGGDFQARIDTIHNLVLPPAPLFSSASPNVPPGTPGQVFIIHHHHKNQFLVPATPRQVRHIAHKFPGHVFGAQTAIALAAAQDAQDAVNRAHDAALAAVVSNADGFGTFVSKHFRPRG
jgi:hypothetical protein